MKVDLEQLRKELIARYRRSGKHKLLLHRYLELIDSVCLLAQRGSETTSRLTPPNLQAESAGGKDR